jgi:hypothetical protein
MPDMDPHSVLGLPLGATAEEAATAYRRLAKEWHPDRGGGRTAERRMAQINAAYDLLRAQAWTQAHQAGAGTPTPVATEAPADPRGRGHWLPAGIRQALGPELLAPLEPDEDIWLVTPTTTWASPQALLAASDRRLLWLLDDAVVQRVHVLRYTAITEAEHHLRRPRRRVAVLRVRAVTGRRFDFGDLRPGAAEAIVKRIREAWASRGTQQPQRIGRPGATP